MTNELLNEWKKEKIVEDGDIVLAGVSGGADSVCLLLMLEQLQKKTDFLLEAVHVEHGIRGEESRKDAAFVKTLCQDHGIRCHIFSVEVPLFAEKHGLGLEEAARILRYDCYKKPAKKPGWRNNPKLRAIQEQEEYNPFLKNSWLIMGQAQFYNADFLQASATFSYIARHYAKDEEVVAEARLWQARCYSEMGWFYESEDILDKMNKNGIPASALKQYAAVYADYLIKNGQFEDAIPYLKTAIKAEKNRKQRTRMKYLLGQIYADQELDGLAYKTFGEVARSNPPYELEFASRIRQTEVFSGTNYLKVVKMLEKMAKSQKNKDYLDQVYYALGNVYLSREDTVNAIKNYQLGIDKSTLNGMDKAICQIKLGDIYFTMRDYVKAQPCFSGALAGIQKEYRDYERVSKLSAILDELVVHVEAVHLQDSLQALAKLPEAERLAIIDKKIEEVKKEEEEAKALAEKEAYLHQGRNQTKL